MGSSRRIAGVLARAALVCFPGYNSSIQFMIPQHFKRLPLGVIIDTRKLDQQRVGGTGWRNYVINEVKALSNLNDLPDFG